MYIEVAMMISWVARVNRSHPYTPGSVQLLNQSQGGMYIEVAMMISWVARVNRSHPYLDNDPAP